MDCITLGKESLSAFLVNSELLTLRGFLTQLLQIGAFLAGVWALVRRASVKPKLGRPVLVINLDMVAESKIYGVTPKLPDLQKLNSAGPENGDRIVSCWKDLSGNIQVNEDLARWGQQPKLVSAIHPPQGGVVPPTRWKSEWAANRAGFGCPTTQGEEFFIAPRETEFLSRLLRAFRVRYDYLPETGWPGRATTKYVPEYRDGVEYSGSALCDFFESECENDTDRTIVAHALMNGSKTLNLLRVDNRTHDTVKDVHIHIGGGGSHSGLIERKIADAEDTKIIVDSFEYSHVVLSTIPPESSRFVVVETRGKPLADKDIRVETGLMTKFGVTTLRWIAILSLVLTLFWSGVTYCWT